MFDIYTEKNVQFDIREIKLNYVNLIYKLLPLREEKKDWQSYLNNIIIELEGANLRFKEFRTKEIFRLISRLNGMSLLVADADFHIYRRNVFECINLLRLEE